MPASHPAILTTALLAALLPCATGQPFQGEPDSLPPSAAATQAEPDAQGYELSLEGAIDLALQNNIGLRIDAFSIDVQRFTYLGSWGAFDPIATVTASFTDAEQQAATSLAGANVVNSQQAGLNAGILFPLETGGTFNLGYDHNYSKTNSTFSVGESLDQAGFSLTYTQPLLRGAWSGYNTVERSQAELRWLQSEAQHDEVEANLRRDVTYAYWDLIASQEALAVQEETLALGLRQLEQNERRLKVGVGTEVEVLQAQTNVATQQEVLLSARSNVSAADDALKSLIFARAQGDGWDAWYEWWDRPIEPLTPLPEVQDVNATWIESLGRALMARPELLQRRHDIEISELDLVKATSEERAALDLQLALSSNAVANTTNTAFETASKFDFPTASASLTYSTPLRNRAAENAYRAARVGVLSARLAYEQTETSVLTEVRMAVRDAHYQAEAVRAAAVSYDLAQRQLEAEEARFAQGISTNFQVLEYQQQLSQAKSNLVAARVAYAKSRTALLRAEGRLHGQGPTPTSADDLDDTPDE